MSLKAWYPLINNLYKNQGTCFGGDIYSSPAFGTTESRLGTSSYTGGNISWTTDQTAKIFNNNALSVAFWIYPMAAASGGIIFGIDANPRRFALYQYHSAADKMGSTFHWSWDPGDSYVAANRVGATIENAMPIGVWTHICVTYQKGIGGRIYINGRSSRTFAFESTVSDFSTAACTVYCNSAARLLNDFRVYDHCLSPLEVYNLAQGLFCHYTFDGWHPENEFTTLLGNSIGSGGALTQESTNTFKLASTTANPPADTGLWLYWVKSSLPGNTRYAFSADVYNASQSANINIHAEGTLRFISSNYYIDDKHIACTRKNQWVTIYGVLDTGADGGASIMFYPNPYNGSFTDGYQLYRNIKLYKNSECTPNDITQNITDNSGFNNNSPSFVMYNYSLGRIGSKTLAFNGTDTFIALPQTCKINSPFTYNLWAYMDDWTGIGGKTIMSCTQSGGYGLFGSDNGTNVIFEAYDTASANYQQLRAAVADYLKPGWHMFTFSLSAHTNGAAYAYIDGECVNSYDGAKYTPLSVASFSYNTNNTIFVGAEAGSNASTPETNYFNGRIDDLRLYASILSEDDIKDLYKARCKVDKSQNLIAAELIEEDAETNITKQGLLKCHNLVELPDNYDYLEYVEATGNSFFDTGLKDRHIWYHDIQFTDLSGRQLMGYGGNGNEYWGIQSYEDKTGCYGHGTASGTTFTYRAGNRDIVIDAYGQSPSFVVNGTTLYNGGDMDLSNKSYKLFALYDLTTDTPYECHCKLYSCAAYSATDAKRIYLPAKTKNGSQVGLYDIIEDKFSAISGLTAGPISTNVSQINKYGYSIFNQFIEE